MLSSQEPVLCAGADPSLSAGGEGSAVALGDLVMGVLKERDQAHPFSSSQPRPVGSGPGPRSSCF